MALLVNVTRDAGYGARLLLKNPGSSAIAIVTLALGIGVTSAVFTIVNAVLFRPLPFHNPDRLVTVIAVPVRRLVSTLFRMRPSPTSNDYPLWQPPRRI